MSTSSDDAFGRELPSIAKIVPYLLLIFTVAFLYLFSPIEMSDNSRAYLDDAQSGADMFYPPHLLHAPIVHTLYVGLSKFTACDVRCAGMAQSMFWASVTVVSVYAIVLAVLGTMTGALLTALMVLVSHGFWVYATQVEVYVPAVGCMTGASALLLTNRRETLGFGRLVLVALLWALATTYHLANVILLIPFAVYFFGWQGPKGFRQLAVVSVLAGTAVLIAFGIAYRWEHGAWSLDDFLAWALSITSVPMTDWGSLSNLWRPGSLFFAGFSLLVAVTLIPEYLIEGQSTYADTQPPLAIIGLLIAAALVWNVVQVLRRGRPVAPRLYLLVLFATYFLFFIWWQPGVHKFFIPALVPVIMLIAFAIDDLYRNVKHVLGRVLVMTASCAAIAVIFIFNLSSVLELQRSRGPDYLEAEILDRLAPKNCTIYSQGHHLSAFRFYIDRRGGVPPAVDWQDSQGNVPMRRLRSSFYWFMKGEHHPRDISLDEEECALIRLGYLSKHFYGYIAGYINGDWEDFIRYFFDVRADGDGPGITHSAYKLVSYGDGPPHALLDRGTRVREDSIDDLLDAISSAVDAASAKYHTDQLQRVSSAKTDVSRVRERIFGYSSGDLGTGVGWPGDDHLDH